MSCHLDCTDIGATAISPEQRMFVGVIVNAAIDAAGRGFHNTANERDRNQVKAYAWFQDAGDDFKMVCELAGLDPDHVCEGVLDYVARVKAGHTRAPKRPASRPRATGRVTVDHVAAHADVSPTSVHNALRNRASPRIARRVAASIVALGFEPVSHVR